MAGRWQTKRPGPRTGSTASAHPALGANDREREQDRDERERRELARHHDRRNLQRALWDGLDERLDEEARVRVKLTVEERPERVSPARGRDSVRRPQADSCEAAGEERRLRLEKGEDGDELGEGEGGEEDECLARIGQVRAERDHEHERVARLRERKDAARDGEEAHPARLHELDRHGDVKSDVSERDRRGDKVKDPLGVLVLVAAARWR
mmetsp:Transcript_41563/g.114445  ORF Transcript_41563/g.114445 Transcript_41563/m.114445 type:complete len:210 (+) Transcript_41563:70-699(+)